MSDITEHLFEFQAQFAATAAALEGAVRELTSQGFSDEQARSIVTSLISAGVRTAGEG